MRISSFAMLAFLPVVLNNAWANTFTQSEPLRTEQNHSPKVAEIVAPAVQPNLPTLEDKSSNQRIYTPEELAANPLLTHQLLAKAIYAREPEIIQNLLDIYRTFTPRDENLVQFAEAKIAALTENYPVVIEKYRAMLAKSPNLNAVRVELAIVLFQQKHDRAAKSTFEQALQVENLPNNVRYLIQAYLDALDKRDSWDLDFNAYYLRDTNINNTSKSREIEQTGFVKGDKMLPQKAHGFAYSFDLSRDFNLTGSHYFSLQNELDGKTYWDNHEYDELNNRLSLGYAYKTAKQTWRLQPFYEYRWSGGEKYRGSNGVRVSLQHWLNARWQLSLASEWSKMRYADSISQNGNNKLFSATAVWFPSNKYYFYAGADFNAERTIVRQYSSDFKNLRLGWGQSWGKGISSRLSLSLGERQYKDKAVLGGIIPLDKIRKDKIYAVNLQLWKQDFQLWGIMPKLNLSWRKQASNLPTMYSYTDRNINVFFERRF